MIGYHLLRYACIGVINTLVSYSLIFTLMFLDVNPELSNFVGYFLGFFLSYFLNKKFNFKSKNTHTNDLPRFMASMGMAYILNLLSLGISYRWLKINPYLSQIASGAVYFTVGYGLSKYWVFRERVNENELLQ